MAGDRRTVEVAAVSLDSVDLSSSPVVRRWRRDGHDRAYVKVGSRDIGYRDLNTGDIRCQQNKNAKVVATATADLWAQAQEELRTGYQPRHAAAREDDLSAVPA
jgi:hypothetical protein